MKIIIKSKDNIMEPVACAIAKEMITYKDDCLCKFECEQTLYATKERNKNGTVVIGIWRDKRDG